MLKFLEHFIDVHLRCDGMHGHIQTLLKIKERAFSFSVMVVVATTFSLILWKNFFFQIIKLKKNSSNKSLH